MTIYRVDNLSANSVVFNNFDDLSVMSDLIDVGTTVDDVMKRDHRMTHFDDGTMPILLSRF
ncbi:MULTISPECIES: hypothetical protein [unclassified Paenibacillus]|uniref:hypothetical protein n=1 Tax=unclassified Paenibacillus TaxID=185978 RepID=UPI00117D39F3|nr:MULTISPECIES: hypothetical protein [unclassified Paenibacillus]